MPRRLRLLCAVLGLALLAALSVYAWRSSYSRYITDDFCTASKLRDLGFVEAMKWHRAHWSGRYSFYAVKAIPESIGPATPPVMPAVIITLFCGTAVWALMASRAKDRDPSPLLATITGLAVVFATIDATPEVLAVGGPLIWETGLLTYMLPLVLYGFWLGMFFVPRLVTARVVASALVMFVAGGLSETSLAAQGGLAGGILFLTVLRRIPDAIKIAAAGFVATLLSALVTATAPGNVKRMSELPPQPPLVDAILDAIRLSYSFFGSNVFFGGAALFVVVACGALLGTTRARSELSTILLLAVVSLGAFMVSILPSTWMLSTSPPPRALHVTTFFFAGVLLALSMAAGIARPQLVRTAAPLLLAVSIGVTGLSIAKIARTFDEGRVHVAEVDRITAILQASPGKDVVIRSPYANAQRLLVRDPSFWTNTCICDFYGARSLSVPR